MSDTFRQEYRDLNDAEKASVKDIKNTAEELEALINAQKSNGKDVRLLSIALTHLETSIMFAVKAITK